MNSGDFRMLSQKMNYNSHIAMNPFSGTWNPMGTCRYERKQHLSAKRLWRALKRNCWSSTLFLVEGNWNTTTRKITYAKRRAGNDPLLRRTANWMWRYMFQFTSISRRILSGCFVRPHTSPFILSIQPFFDSGSPRRRPVFDEISWKIVNVWQQNSRF
jgi:hypothetical protein